MAARRSQGGGDSWRANATAGYGDLAKEGYNFFISADHLKQDSLRAADREISRTARIDAVHREDVRTTANRLGIEIRDVLVPSATLALATDAIRKSKSDALVDWTEIPGLPAFLKEARIPACGVGFAFARNGGLLAASFDFNEGTKQAVAIVARILRGESPATIPIYEGTRYGFAVNLRTARAMALTIPASIRIQATEVIE